MNTLNNFNEYPAVTKALDNYVTHPFDYLPKLLLRGTTPTKLARRELIRDMLKIMVRQMNDKLYIVEFDANEGRHISLIGAKIAAELSIKKRTTAHVLRMLTQVGYLAERHSIYDVNKWPCRRFTLQFFKDLHII